MPVQAINPREHVRGTPFGAVSKERAAPRCTTRGHRINTSLLVFILCLTPALTLWPLHGQSGGILHVFPPTMGSEAYAVARPMVLVSRTLVTVSESEISYRIDQTFLNDNDLPLEGVFLFPLEPGEPPGDLAVRVDGVPHEWTLMSPEGFFPMLRELTTKMSDPSLLGLAGRDVLVVKPVNLGVHHQRTVRVEFRRPVRSLGDRIDLSIALDGERYAVAPVGDFEVRVRFKVSRTVRAVFSPSHHVDVFRESLNRCVVTAKTQAKPARDDFLLICALSGHDLDFTVLTHRMPGERGSFMALISPPEGQATAEDTRKDVVFVLDSSGSMARGQMDLVQRVVLLGLEGLQPGDRFNVVVVSTRCARLAPRLLPADPDNLAKAAKFVNSVSTGGGTDLFNGLMTSLDQFTTRRRANIIVLTGDGRGTVGIADPAAIAEAVQRNNRARVRFCVVATGPEADVAMLDKLATANRGALFRVSEREDLPGAMSRLFSGIAPSRVSDLFVDFQGSPPEEMAPVTLPDIVGQEGSLVMGRYDDKGDKTIRVSLKGRVRGRVQTVTKTVTLPAVNERNPFIRALWGMRRIAGLIESEGTKGPDPQTREQVRVLARELGFRSPFPELGQARHGDLVPWRAISELVWRFKRSSVPAEVEERNGRFVGGKVFRADKGAWVDSRYRPGMETRTVRFLGDEYFGVLKSEPDLGPCLALGPDVIVVTRGSAIRVISH